MADGPEAVNQVYNVALGDRTTLNELFAHIRTLVARGAPEAAAMEPVYRDFRAGDVKHSQADISKARTLLGYEPTHRVVEGLGLACGWYESLGK